MSANTETKNTSPETTSKLQRTVTLKLSGDRINSEVEKRLKKIAKTARMPGFRPGKVPMKMLVQSYGPEVHSDVLNDELGKTFQEEVQKGQHRVAGTPKIEKAQNASDQDALEFDATFEVFPEITLGDFSTLEIEQTVTEVSDTEVSNTIDILRKQRVEYVEVSRAAQNDDKVTLDFTGKIDGVAFQGGTAQDFTFMLGKGQMLPEFEAAAQGLKAGESKTFDLKFPDDYHGKDVAGKTSQFEITLKKVEGAELPEVNEEFVKSMGIAEGSIDKLREDVKTNLSREVNNRAKVQTKNSVMNALLKVAEFDVPKSLLEQESTELVQRARANLKERGIKNVEQVPLQTEVFDAQAERRVRLGLIVSELVKKQGLEAKPEQVRDYIEEQAQSYESPAEVLQWYFQDRNRLAEVEAIVVEDNVVQWVLKHAKVTEKKLPFDELMGKK
ncbi:MAG: trigger factor [Limnobacter sp.]|nr:trigger factor [Limnobacter sp.]